MNPRSRPSLDRRPALGVLLAVALLVVTCVALVVVGRPSSKEGAGRSAGPPPGRPALPCGPTIRKPDGTAWMCTFADNFSGTALNSAKWAPIRTAENGITGGGPVATPACYVGSRQAISVGGGVLRLTAHAGAPALCQSPNGSFSTPYSTGQVATYGKFSQTYGRFSVRAKFPASSVAGLQSSLWLWPQHNITTTLTGEIDIVEEYSAYSDRVVPYLHYPMDSSTVDLNSNTNIYTSQSCRVADVAQFHDYTTVWSSTTIEIYVDGTLCMQDNVRASGPSPFDQPYFVNLSQALGLGNNPFGAGTTPLPATTEVDWVRVWK